MNDKTKTIALAVAFVALVGVAAFAYSALSQRDGAIPSNLSVSQQDEDAQSQLAPNATVTTANGEEVELSSLLGEGKPVVINFWASWCPPCQEEMPYFDEVYKELGDQVTFVMIDAVDGQRETVQTGQDFITSKGYQFPIYFDTAQDAQMAYGVTGYPETLFINSKGEVVGHAQGGIAEQTLRDGIAQAQK